LGKRKIIVEEHSYYRGRKGLLEVAKKIAVSDDFSNNDFNARYGTEFSIYRA
jgi:hypothetical protein